MRRNMARAFFGPCFFRTVARVLYCLRFCRNRRKMALRGRFDRKFRLLPPPWRYSTLYQWLQRPCARLVGDATETVAQRTAVEGCETCYCQKKIRGARFI